MSSSLTCGNHLRSNVKDVLKRDKYDCCDSQLTRYLQRNSDVYNEFLPTLIRPCCKLNSTHQIDGEIIGMVRTSHTDCSSQQTDVVSFVNGHSSGLSIDENCEQTVEDIKELARNALSNLNTRKDSSIGECLGKVSREENVNSDKMTWRGKVEAGKTKKSEVHDGNTRWINNRNIIPSCNCFSKTVKSEEEGDSSDVERNSSQHNLSLDLSKQITETADWSSSLSNTTSLRTSDILSYSHRNSSRVLDKAGNVIFYPGKPELSCELSRNLSRAHSKLEPMKTLSNTYK